MWVADERVEEYKAAGFVPAAEHVQPTEGEVKNDKPKGGRKKK